MSKLKLTSIFICMIVLGVMVHAGPVTEQRKSMEKYKGDPAALRSLHPTFEEFPDSSLVDFSYLLSPPAGKNGKVYTGADGHFYFTKTNQRVRFWGVTVAASNIDVPKTRIKEAVDAMAHAGINMLRLHEIDNRGGEQYNLVRRNIIDESFPNNKDSRHFDKEYRDRVDYWIKCAKDQGIYVYLVVRGYRTFREGDGVPNADQLDRSAKPYAFFNRRLIDLQKEYADEFLIKHINPYTGIANGLDPAVALIEIENEDSLFFDPTRWNKLVEPYRTELQGYFNDYLVRKYKTTDALKKAWTNNKGECALSAEESLEAKNVLLPDMPMYSVTDIPEMEIKDVKRAPLRCDDGSRFGVELQRKYFKEMRDFIRSKGCTVPMCAVVHSGVKPDTYSTAEELDFTAENCYLDHPSFMPGAAWVGMASFQNKNYINANDRWGMMPFMTGYKWAGKPLVCREWATCWPNRYRVSSILEIASYSLLQDFDAMIYFCYDTFGNNKMNETFGLQSDPTRWGMFGYGSRLFIQGDVAPAKKLIEVGYTDKDLYTWGGDNSSLGLLSWTYRMQNTMIDPLHAPKADIQIPIMRAVAARDGKYPKTDAQVFEEIQGKHTTSWIVSSGGQLSRDTVKGFALIDTPTFQCIQGELEIQQPYETGNVKLYSSSSVGSLVVASLDGKPISKSNHYSLKMATVSVNRGERLDVVTTAQHDAKHLLVNLGAPPVQTMAKPVDKPAQVYINGNLLAEVYLENGTWEIEVNKESRYIRVFCDTQNTKFTIYPVTPKGWVMQKYFYEYPPDAAEAVQATFIYPGFSKYVQLIDMNKPPKPAKKK